MEAARPLHQPKPRDVVIVSAVRTPLCRARKGALAKVPPSTLLSTALSGEPRPHCCACAARKAASCESSACSLRQYSRPPRSASPPPQCTSVRSKNNGCDHIGCSRRARRRQTPPCLPEKSSVGSLMACPCAVVGSAPEGGRPRRAC